MDNSLIPKHGGYRKLKSFQLAQLVYDATKRFCDRFIYTRSRTHDQMVQAARSGVQNIAEGSQASGTSKKTELKLTNVARASLEELELDFEDFLRQGNFVIWAENDPRRYELIAKRFDNVDKIALWVKEVCKRNGEPVPQVAANAIHVLIGVACRLLDRQIKAQAKAFETEGGFTERLYHRRKKTRQY